MKDVTGAAVFGTLAELRSEQAPDKEFRTEADSNGIYRFAGLPAGEYTLKLSRPGFQWLNVKSIHISEGEQKSLPTFELSISTSGCSPYAVVEYIRLLQSEEHIGNLGGSIRLDQGPMVGKSPPVPDANVTLICSTGKFCGATKTDSKGQFAFNAMRPGDYSVRINRAGFYPLNEPGYKIDEGFESIYYSIYIEACPLGNCDPRLRPKKPPALCE